MALSKSVRLKKQKDITTLLRSGAVARGSTMNLRVLNSGLSEKPKVLVTISNSIAPTIVVRNKLRRKVLTALESLVPRMKKGSHILFSVQRTPAATEEEITREIVVLLEKFAILSK